MFFERKIFASSVENSAFFMLLSFAVFSAVFIADGFMSLISTFSILFHSFAILNVLMPEDDRASAAVIFLFAIFSKTFMAKIEMSRLSCIFGL